LQPNKKSLSFYKINNAKMPKRILQYLINHKYQYVLSNWCEVMLYATHGNVYIKIKSKIKFIKSITNKSQCISSSAGM
jgi:hypothetical protein